jgi:hypothetical protein
MYEIILLMHSNKYYLTYMFACMLQFFRTKLILEIEPPGQIAMGQIVFIPMH